MSSKDGVKKSLIVDAGNGWGEDATIERVAPKTDAIPLFSTSLEIDIG